MEGFREGYEFFQKHTGNFSGLMMAVQYVDTVNLEINKFN